MTVQEISGLFRYAGWATDRTLETVSALPAEKYHRDLKSSHGGIHGTLVHTWAADLVWLQRWQGKETHGLTPVDKIPSFDALERVWKEYRGELTEYLARLDDARLSAPLNYLDTRGNPHAEPLVQQMLHCVNHATYHRGQVVTMLRQLEVTPQNTDLISFYRAMGK